MALPLLLGPMLASLLGVGVLGAGREFMQNRQQAREDERARGLLGLVGTPGQYNMGPPDEAGGLGFSEGTGLLGRRADPGGELGFAAGVMAQPGMAGVGMNMLREAFARAQQGEQFQQGRQDRAAEFAAQQAAQQRQYLLQRDQYQAGRGDAMFGQRMDLARLALAQNADKRATDAANAPANPADLLPKLSTGYQYVPTPQGLVAAPVPGTPDYIKVTDSDGALASSVQAIDEIKDIVLGPQKMVGDKMVRAGGTGFELYGSAKGTLQTKRAEVVASIAVMRGLGVLQEGEAKRLEDQIPDFGGTWGPGKLSQGMAAMDEVRNQLNKRRETIRRGSPWLPPLQPAGTPPLPAGFRALP